MEGMPVATLAAKKKSLVQELNAFIAQKKALTEEAESLEVLKQGSRKGAQTPRSGAGKSSSAVLTIPFVKTCFGLLSHFCSQVEMLGTFPSLSFLPKERLSDITKHAVRLQIFSP